MPCLKKNASQKLSFLHDLNKHNVYRGIKVIDADGDVGTNATSDLGTTHFSCTYSMICDNCSETRHF